MTMTPHDYIPTTSEAARKAQRTRRAKRAFLDADPTANRLIQEIVRLEIEQVHAADHLYVREHPKDRRWAPDCSPTCALRDDPDGSLARQVQAARAVLLDAYQAAFDEFCRRHAITLWYSRAFTSRHRRRVWGGAGHDQTTPPASPECFTDADRAALTAWLTANR